MEEIKNKVAESGLITVDLENYYPQSAAAGFDIKDFLFMEMLLKEKDFRESVEKHNWMQYAGKDVGIYCSTDAIIPMWAYMLIVSKLSGVAASVSFGTPDEVFKNRYIEQIQKIDPSPFEGKRVVVKGCGEKEIPACVYTEISKKLIPVVKSLMYGEPCSTVPVYKKKNQ